MKNPEKENPKLGGGLSSTGGRVCSAQCSDGLRVADLPRLAPEALKPQPALLRRQPLLCLGRVVCLHFPDERLVFLRQFEQPGPGLLIGDAAARAR